MFCFLHLTSFIYQTIHIHNIAGDWLSIPIKNLHQPAETRLTRKPDSAHVKLLVQTMRGKDQVNPLIVNIPNMEKSEVLLSQATKGLYHLEVIGGNHTRLAFQQLNEESQQFATARVRLYAGLTDQQALWLGYQHNQQHEHSRKTTFVENVLLFRRCFEALVADPDKPRNAEKEAVRKHLAEILDMQVSLIIVNNMELYWATECYSLAWSYSNIS